ncbi:MAG: hypothetical protein MPEBLZ_04248 [Candidatus Methanoperedens nitroreducens]|uniref:Uncharacterized protein n=1 Tax=Candidatus Methanoperedens nitratireducens TaxID=1392998 RepID=A0A0P8C3R7_9EURY|nr:hypothetical protein [Candidatus Methanoperedens sp. BLZ2]KAB2942400.1 MAG: hypothetical protein F9K14_17270 [Candidatus Methanoperedens sp.]KPQ41192.1 MAG: hypothetical protein MPEBLZ_04248 [Candidatus Methanoperedens sp. BLZ1]MBZ0176659.1 hypothetical protein [Candidatus Methanoperedens nitroreducens]MCX9080383.1 hypothetical protein [Candidatus Methanoperedens sp.]
MAILSIPDKIDQTRLKKALLITAIICSIIGLALWFEQPHILDYYFEHYVPVEKIYDPDRYLNDLTGKIILFNGTVVSSQEDKFVLTDESNGYQIMYTSDKRLNCIPPRNKEAKVAGYFGTMFDSNKFYAIYVIGGC